MPPAKPNANAVDEFMKTLDHPRKPMIEALRTILRGADPSISEGIKWNAPSYRTVEWFATMNLRSKVGMQVILHLGAKAKEKGWKGFALADPAGLVTWLGKDRGIVTFADLKAIQAHRTAFVAIIRQWIRHVTAPA